MLIGLLAGGASGFAAGVVVAADADPPRSHRRLDRQARPLHPPGADQQRQPRRSGAGRLVQRARRAAGRLLQLEPAGVPVIPAAPEVAAVLIGPDLPLTLFQGRRDL